MPGQSDRLFTVLLGLLGLSAAVALAAPEPAQACARAVSARAGAAAPEPPAPDTGCATPPLPPSGGGGVGRGWPWLAADPTQPLVAGSRWKLTGSAVTMTGLRLDGIVDLPTAEGSLRALKFTMDQAVVDDFLLRSTGPAETPLFAADRLALQGNVALYTTRFAGRMVGIDIILTPNLPLPDGLPATQPSPITFTDTTVDLAFVGSDALTAGPTLRVAID